MIVKLLSAITILYLAKHIEVKEYGLISLALAISAIAAYFCDLGLTHTFIREATKQKASIINLLNSFLRIRVILSIITILLISVYIYLNYTDDLSRKVLLFIIIPSIASAAIQGVSIVYYQITQNMKFISFIRIISGLFANAALLFSIFLEIDIISLAFYYGIAILVGGLFSLIFVRDKIFFNYKFEKSLLEGLGNFLLGGFIVMALPQVGIIVLEKVSNLKEVGYFSVAYRIPAILYQIPGVVAAAFYPLLYKYGNSQNTDKHTKLIINQLNLMSLLGILLALPFFFYAEWFVITFLGEKWISSSLLLQVLSALVLFQSINYPLADYLTTSGFQHKRTKALIVTFLFSIGLSWSLGNVYGALGVAYAVIGGEVCFLILLMFADKSSINLFKKGVVSNIFAMLILIALNNFLEIKFALLGILINTILFIIIIFIVNKEIRSYCKNFFNILRKR